MIFIITLMSSLVQGNDPFSGNIFAIISNSAFINRLLINVIYLYKDKFANIESLIL